MKQATKTDASWEKTLVCVGSNVTSIWGDPEATVKMAVRVVSDRFRAPIEVSRFYKTPAFPADSGDDFVNAAFAFQTQLSAHEILLILHEVEAEAMRRRESRWAARTLDLDLIAVADQVVPDPQVWQNWAGLPLEEQQRQAPDQLILPHPRVQDRAFALVPLCDVAPDWRHPVLDQTLEELRDALPASDLESVVPLN